MQLDVKKRHLQFDFGKAATIYQDSEELEGEHITSPFHLYSVETLRERHNLKSGRSQPTDVFVFGKGPARDPAVTKVSGLPFWPADKKWPANNKNEPLRFVAQVNFENSTDLFPSLPGDLLLLFVENDESEDWLWEKDLVHFEWVRTKGVTPIKSFPSRIRSYAESEFYGVIHRTADFPDHDPKSIDVPVARYLPVISGTKIGGLPSYIQHGGSPKGTFLAQIGSIQAAPEVKFPWTNQETPLPLFDDDGIHGEANECIFSDLGSVYIFIDQAGNCSTRIDTY